ncbi:MAG: hypothetical protein ACNI3C_05435 [Candidatus Marinarcus sp.]|uniref:hypothetical protein n=1 Tax=Candidatus Marinarcus sp. TaxID=3100987 RepID=UPI003B00BE48
MQTIVLLLILFLIALFAAPLYLKEKKSKSQKLQNGICPSCGAKPTLFFDKERSTTFSVNPIESHILQKSCCSGVNEIEYVCKKCGHKEVHSLH